MSLYVPSCYKNIENSNDQRLTTNDIIPQLLHSFSPQLLNSFTPINEKNVFIVFLMIDLYHRVMKIEMVKRSANLFVRTIYQLKIQSTWYFKSIIRPVFNVFSISFSSPFSSPVFFLVFLLY